jgi:uncharacterized Fe-S cluster-containing radical SAM superfamily protein
MATRRDLADAKTGRVAASPFATGRETAPAGRFADRFATADGSPRASVPLTSLDTLWFNTGTLCNLSCVNCYIESSPRNDALAYLQADDVRRYLVEIAERDLPTREIGFTGGEPFMNPEILEMLELTLGAGFNVLVLTNAMRPMMRWGERLSAINERFPGQLNVRVSLDHHTQALHDSERGPGAWDKAWTGLSWLRDRGFRIAIAGRRVAGESEDAARSAYASLFQQNRLPVEANDPAQLVLFPEMEALAAVPEISEGCWAILRRSPAEMMCATSRMVVRRKGAEAPAVLACTLIPYDGQFELGPTLADAAVAVQLNHPFCAQFCVLGGASCSGA